MFFIFPLIFSLVTLVLLCFYARKFLEKQAKIECIPVNFSFFEGAFLGTQFGYIVNQRLARENPNNNCKKSLILYVMAYIVGAYLVESILRWMPVPSSLAGLISLFLAFFIVRYTCRFLGQWKG